MPARRRRNRPSILDIDRAPAFIGGIKTYGLVIHGGAGAILRGEMKAADESAYRSALGESLRAGHDVLERGGPSMDAVVAAIRVMEDCPLFNAGFGSVLNAEGDCEMDAAIMDGRTLAAGSVAALRHIRSPILLARAVLEKSPHVLLVGTGAEQFARDSGFELVSNGVFRTQRRIRELALAKRLEKDPDAARLLQSMQERMVPEPGDPDGQPPQKMGTVGCVALDTEGNLAAGTSTGGLTNKKFGRVGDSPIVGAGTFANNRTAAVSCTGHGEFFIRAVAAYDISARIEYAGLALEAAAEASLKKVAELGGDGGLIAIDRNGCVAMPFNTPGMYRGFRLSTGQSTVELYGAGK